MSKRINFSSPYKSSQCNAEGTNYGIVPQANVFASVFSEVCKAEMQRLCTASVSVKVAQVHWIARTVEHVPKSNTAGGGHMLHTLTQGIHLNAVNVRMCRAVVFGQPWQQLCTSQPENGWTARFTEGQTVSLDWRSGKLLQCK
jgi:hypothetical protein